MHKSPPSFDSLFSSLREKKKKKKIHTYVSCLLREKHLWKNGEKREVRKVFDIPFNPVGPINRGSADPILATSPGISTPRQGTNHGVETRFVTRWLGWIVAFENFIRQRWANHPPPQIEFRVTVRTRDSESIRRYIYMCVCTYMEYGPAIKKNSRCMDKSIDRQLSEFWNEIEISSSKNLTRLRWRTSEIVQRNYGKCAYVRKKSIWTDKV